MTDPAPMRVLDRAVYRGANPWSHHPMIRIELDLGALEAHNSATLPGFTAALLARLPGLARHGCSYGRPGGFVRRLEDGTWMGHVAEHVALELQALAGHGPTRGKTRSARGRPGVYHVLYAYENETTALAAGRAALEIVAALLPPELAVVEGLDRLSPPADDGEAEVARLARRSNLGPSTAALVEEAERRQIPWRRLDDHSLVQFGMGVGQQRVRATVTSLTSLIGAELAGDKHLARTLLARAGIPVPRGVAIRTADEAEAATRSLRWPLVVKPLDGNHGRGVHLGLTTRAAVRAAFDDARTHSRRVIVEEQLTGNDHRILVVAGKVVAVAERVPAHVVGDGTATLRELIARTNADPRRGDGHAAVLTRIRLDGALRIRLDRLGVTLDHVPGAGETLFLRDTANLSTGGTAIDRTDAIHPANASIARRAARIIGLDVCGIDFLCDDIAKPVLGTGGGVIEVNAAPGLRMHLAPSEGIARPVAVPIMAHLFPKGATGRIPIVSVTGTNGKSTTCRMAKHILRTSGLRVGLTSTTGIYIDEILSQASDASGPRSAKIVLSDPTVEIAVLETARGGILREGLGYDHADIGAVLNVSADHLGLGGVETVEDLARVKSIVVETVRRGGASILNWDDPLTRAMARRAGGRVHWFTLNGPPVPGERLAGWIARGHPVIAREPGPHGGTIALYNRAGRSPLMEAAEIPATLGGQADFNIANAMAAAAIALAQGVAPETVRLALSTFQSSYELNPGRLNVVDIGGVRFIVDYAHNPAGMAALADLVRKLRPNYTRVLGLVCIPGDRRDEDVREFVSTACAVFDRLYLREEPGLRGRVRGEMIALQRQAALDAGYPDEHIVTRAYEPEAIAAMLADTHPGDLAVLTVTDIPASWRQVTRADAG